jgi:hypothetical protein
MTDETALIQKTFEEYAEAFQALKPRRILRFFHFPIMMISPQRVAVVSNPFIGYFGFGKEMKKLKQRCFSGSEAESLKVQQLSDNLAIVTGVVIRYKQCKDENQRTLLECFNLNYTMRKVNEDWKIITGVLTETSCSSIQDAKASTLT